METVTRIRTETEKVKFGYWDSELEEFVPIDAAKVASLKAAVEHFDCSEELVGALDAMFERLIEAICTDLEDIWKRLDQQV